MIDTQKIELSNYSLAELHALSVDHARQVNPAEKRELADARRRIEQIAFQAGLTLEALVAESLKNRVQHRSTCTW